jgi:hypothetical protein
MAPFNYKHNYLEDLVILVTNFIFQFLLPFFLKFPIFAQLNNICSFVNLMYFLNMGFGNQVNQGDREVGGFRHNVSI